MSLTTFMTGNAQQLLASIQGRMRKEHEMRMIPKQQFSQNAAAAKARAERAEPVVALLADPYLKTLSRVELLTRDQSSTEDDLTSYTVQHKAIAEALRLSPGVVRCKSNIQRDQADTDELGCWMEEISGPMPYTASCQFAVINKDGSPGARVWAGRVLFLRTRTFTNPCNNETLVYHDSITPEIEHRIRSDLTFVRAQEALDGHRKEEEALKQKAAAVPNTKVIPTELETAPRCALCGKQNAVLQKCARCKSARYCSKDCQQQHWGAHKGFCVAPQ